MGRPPGQTTMITYPSALRFFLGAGGGSGSSSTARGRDSPPWSLGARATTMAASSRAARIMRENGSTMLAGRRPVSLTAGAWLHGTRPRPGSMAGDRSEPSTEGASTSMMRETTGFLGQVDPGQGAGAHRVDGVG